MIEIQVHTEGTITRYKKIPQSVLNSVLALIHTYEQPWESWVETSKSQFKWGMDRSAYMVKRLRVAAYLSQAKLANALQMSQSNLSQIETGKRPVGKRLAKRLAVFFNNDYRLFL